MHKIFLGGCVLFLIVTGLPKSAGAVIILDGPRVEYMILDSSCCYQGAIWQAPFGSFYTTPSSYGYGIVYYPRFDLQSGTVIVVPYVLRSYPGSSYVGTPAYTITTYYRLTYTSRAFTSAQLGGGFIHINIENAGLQWVIPPTVTTEADGREVVLGPTVIDGIAVSSKIYVPQDEQWVRRLSIVQNTTGSALTITELKIRNGGYWNRSWTTSSGNRRAEVGDRWVVMTNVTTPLGYLCCNGHASFNIDGPGAADTFVTYGSIFPWSLPNENNTNWGYENIELAPGEMKVYAYFMSPGTFLDEVIEMAKKIDNVPDSMTHEMSTKEIEATRNWDFSGKEKPLVLDEELINFFGGNCKSSVIATSGSVTQGLGPWLLLAVWMVHRRRRRV